MIILFNVKVEFLCYNTIMISSFSEFYCLDPYLILKFINHFQVQLRVTAVLEYI